MEEIKLFNTVLSHPDRSRIVIPNRKIAGEILHNYGTLRQLDVVVGVAYDTDIAGAAGDPRPARRASQDPAGTGTVIRVLTLRTPACRSPSARGPRWPISITTSGDITQAVLETFRERGIHHSLAAARSTPAGGRHEAHPPPVPAPKTAYADPLAEVLRPGQSIELLKELHILTRDGKLNQDSRRKLKQVYHLCHFIEPLLNDVLEPAGHADAGRPRRRQVLSRLHPVRPVSEGPSRQPHLRHRDARRAGGKIARTGGAAGFPAHVLSQRHGGGIDRSPTQLPASIDIVTALHACNTATDDAIQFALAKQARHIVLVPCCQAEVAAVLRKHKNESFGKTAAVRNLAPPDPHARIRQPAHQRAALPATGSRTATRSPSPSWSAGSIR